MVRKNDSIFCMPALIIVLKKCVMHLKRDELLALAVDTCQVALHVPEEHAEGGGHGSSTVHFVDFSSFAQR
jgi:hypothetical protein